MHRCVPLGIAATIRRLARLLLPTLVLLILLPAASTSARLMAQTCTEEMGCGINRNPTIRFDPVSTTVSTTTVQLTVYLTDDYSLDSTSLTTSGVTLTGAWYGSWAVLTGTVTVSSPSTTVTVSVRDNADGYASESVTFTYSPPPEPPVIPARDSAALSLPAYSSSVRQVAACAGCFYATASYATPAYISRDRPRSVQLLYSSGQAQFRGLVQVDARVHTTTTPDWMSVGLKFGPFPVTLTNGGSESFFAGDTGSTRLAAQFDPASWGLVTGIYDWVATVRTGWLGTVMESSTPIHALVIGNDASLPGATGWTLVGLERMWFDGLGSLAITDGAGGILGFVADGAGGWVRPAGDFTTLTYTSGVYTRAAIDGSFSRFNSSGFLTATGNRFGDSTLYAYDVSNRLTSITDEAGQITRLAYAPDSACLAGLPTGALCAIETPGGRISKFVSNSSNDLVKIVDPDGVTAFTGTYSDHYLTSTTDRLGAQTTFAYDGFGALAKITGPSVATTSTSGTTATASQVDSLRSIESSLLSLSNDSAATARASVRPDSAYAALYATNGTVTKMWLQGAGEPTKIEVTQIGGAKQVTTTSYGPDLLPYVVHTSPLGGRYTYGWSNGQMTSLIEPAGSRQITYGPYGQVVTVSSSGDVQQTNHYSGADSTLEYTVVGNDTTRYTWDAHGRLTGTSDPLGRTTSVSYESGGFQNTHQTTATSFSSPSFTTTMSYDQFGRNAVIIDALGDSTTIAYDVLNRPTLVTQPGTATTSTSYAEDTTGHTFTTTVTDPRSLTFGASSNAIGWGTSATDPQSHSSAAGYDRNGLLRRAVDRAGGIVTFNYDSLGRVVSRTANSATTTFGYDTAQTLTAPHWSKMQNAQSFDSVTTDGAGRVRSVYTLRSGLGAYISTLSYDDYGNRSMLRTEHSTWTDSLIFESDVNAYPRSLPDFRGKWGTVHLNKANLLDSLRYPTADSTHRLVSVFSGYTSSGQPTSVELRIAATPIEAWQYTYDAKGRLKTTDHGSSLDHIRRTFTYDARGRLSGYEDRRIYADSVQQPCPDFQEMCEPPPPWDYTFYEDVVRGATYSPDKSGNRTDGSASLDNDRLHSMTGADGRLYTFEYDDEGRVISKGASGYSQTYGWNDLGQLIWVKTNGDSVAFGYDAAGRRVRKYHAGTVTGYLWDGDNLLMELDGGGNRVLQYTYEPGVDRPYSVKAGGNTYYYQLDQTGSVIGVWNTSNSKVDSYTYDPFGYTVASSGSFAQPLRWKGREFDAETGLYYMRARYYDPTVGRFISEDPIGIAAGVNPYTFADGDPVNRVDPTGMCGKTALVWQHYFENPSDNYYEVLAVWYDSDGCGKGDGGGGGGTGASAGPKAPHCSEALVAAGNSLADLSLSLGSYSSGMTAGGLALAVVFPEVAASGWALAEAGGYLGLASAGSQVGSGIMHGLGGAGWSNALNGTTSIAAAYVFGKFFATPNTAGYKTRSQRNWIKSMEKAEAIAGGLFDLITGVNPNAGAKQASCSP